MRTSTSRLHTMAWALIFLTALTAACKRESMEEPSLFGPSTYSTLLNLTASPNVLFAGDSREGTTITATLRKFDGIPIPNTPLFFEIKDELGLPLFLGLFEGNQTVQTKMTDANGQVQLSYFGPLARELDANTTVFIYAVLSNDTKERIAEFIPIYIIDSPVEIIFEVFADPNILWATNQRPVAQITAAFKKTDGTPFVGRKVFFTILSGPGIFADKEIRTFVNTGPDGIATIDYIGPTRNEISSDQFVTIKAQPETTTPDYLHKEISIRILRGS